MVIWENAKAKPEYVKAKTGVLWDMETCPVPDGYNARRIRPSIECALKDLGYYGPVTITAIGNLEIIPPHVLPGLASTGIDVQHTFSELLASRIYEGIMRFVVKNPAPATVMLISDQIEAEMAFSYGRDQQFSRSGYNLVLAKTYTKNTLPVLCTTAEWIWKSLLLGSHKQETHVLRKSGESSSFECTSCFYTCTSLEDLTTHLSAKEHKLQEIKIIKSRLRVLQLREEDDLFLSKYKRRRLRTALRMDFRLLRKHLRLRSLRLRRA